MPDLTDLTKPVDSHLPVDPPSRRQVVMSLGFGLAAIGGLAGLYIGLAPRHDFSLADLDANMQKLPREVCFRAKLLPAGKIEAHWPGPYWDSHNVSGAVYPMAPVVLPSYTPIDPISGKQFTNIRVLEFSGEVTSVLANPLSQQAIFEIHGWSEYQGKSNVLNIGVKDVKVLPGI